MDREYILRLGKIEGVLNLVTPITVDQSWTKFAFGTPAGPVPGELAETLTAPGKDLIYRGVNAGGSCVCNSYARPWGGRGQALPLEPMVDRPHNGSLIYDDIEDGSDERRDKPTIHILYGVDTAINSCCFLFLGTPHLRGE